MFVRPDAASCSSLNDDDDAEREPGVRGGDGRRGDLAEHEGQLHRVELDDVDAPRVVGVGRRRRPQRPVPDAPAEQAADEVVEVADGRRRAGVRRARRRRGRRRPRRRRADHTAAAARYWRAAGTSGSRAVRIAAACSASMVAAPASATTSPVGVGDVGRQVDREVADRLEQLGEPRRVDDLDLVELQAQRDLELARPARPGPAGRRSRRAAGARRRRPHWRRR